MTITGRVSGPYSVVGFESEAESGGALSVDVKMVGIRVWNENISP